MEERIHPRMVVEYHLERHGVTLAQVGVSDLVVLTWGKGVVIRLSAAFESLESVESWLYPDRVPMFTGSIDGRRVTVVQSMVGAPATVMLMEELIACGARTIIGIGWAGSLQPENPVGSLLLPTGCVREEGTSRLISRRSGFLHRTPGWRTCWRDAPGRWDWRQSAAYSGRQTRRTAS